jgi:hypothetical protein
MTRKVPHLGGPHGQHDAKIALPVCIEKNKNGSAAGDGEAVPKGEFGGVEGAEASYCGLGAR